MTASDILRRYVITIDVTLRRALFATALYALGIALAIIGGHASIGYYVLVTALVAVTWWAYYDRHGRRPMTALIRFAHRIGRSNHRKIIPPAQQRDVASHTAQHARLRRAARLVPRMPP